MKHAPTPLQERRTAFVTSAVCCFALLGVTPWNSFANQSLSPNSPAVIHPNQESAASSARQLSTASTLTLAQRAEEAPARKAPATSKKKKANDANRRKQEAAALAKKEAEQREAEERKRLNEQRIQELLAAAKVDTAAGRLLEPPGNCAADRFQEVLSLDPVQLEALAGAQRITKILAAEAERTAAAGYKSRTAEIIGRIRALQPMDASLKELDARYSALEATPVTLSERQLQRFDRAAQNIDKSYEYLKQQPLDMTAVDMAISEYDRAVKWVELSPGLPTLEDRIVTALKVAAQTELNNNEPKRTLKIVKTARKRSWIDPELEMLENTAKESIATKKSRN